MTEIRTITADEADDFLELLCTVFKLEISRARGIFYTEPLFDLSRKWALFEGREMISILTTTPLQFGWGKAYGIAGVATRLDRQGEGNASKLLERVHRESAHRDEIAGLLFAKDVSVYERNGFESIDRVVRTGIVCDGDTEIQARPLDNPAIQQIYDHWAASHPDRLRRDKKRWEYWHWNYRICDPYNGGYLCVEPNVVREAIYDSGASSLPLPASTEWFGTTFMADLLEIPLLHAPRVELFLMGRDVPGIPQMFMTDQF